MTQRERGAGRERARRRPPRLRVVADQSQRRVVHVRGTGFVPVEANLQRPRPRDGIVTRGELVDTLREHDDVPVVLITGPAGYGKTTLLAQWELEDERPFAWLSLDDSSNDAAVLVTYVMLALQQLGDADVGVLHALADQSAVSTVLLPRLGRMFTRQQTPFVLVIDNAGSVTSPEALDVLMVVARHLNEGSQLVLAARTAPDLPWSQLLTERRLLTIGPDELRLTPSEARAALAVVGVDLAEEDVTALLTRTEGWPAGVHLAALSLRHAVHRRDSLASFGERGSAIAAYLREELFAGLSPEQRRFLVRTSVLDRMCGPLCDAVLATTGSADTLRDLHRSNMFVVTLDAEEQWYRYHQLFAEMLRGELSREDAGVVTALHSRASRWLEETGRLDDAVRHAQAAHEVVRAAQLVWSQAGPMLASGQSATLRRWLDGFTSDQLVGHASLALTAAWCALDSGRPVDLWIAAAERGVFDATRPGETDSMASGLALLHAYRARDGLQRMLAQADEAARLQAPADPWGAFAQYLRAVAVMLGGAPEQARAALETTARLAATLDMPVHQALCLAQLSVLAGEAGDWDKAGELADAATDLITAHGVDDSPTISLVHCAATVTLAKRGSSEEMKRLARRSMRMIAVLNQCPPWLAVETRYLLGRAHLLTGDTAAARVLFSEAQTQMRAIPDAGWLATRLGEAWTHVEKFPLATGMGPSALTSAELRVLHLLPTHLSFEQISERLSVSRNTVKTQAIAAYRKLGVSSRAEAVERARSLGMIAG